MENSKLSKNEMKNLLGGAQSGSTCSTTCADGTKISITCDGTCSATTGVSVLCLGGGGAKYCHGKEPSNKILQY